MAVQSPHVAQRRPAHRNRLVPGSRLLGPDPTAGPVFMTYGQAVQRDAKGFNIAGCGRQIEGHPAMSRAAEKFFEVLSLEPDNISSHQNLGTLYLAAGDFVKALEHSEKAYKLDPRSTEAMSTIGAVCRQQGNFQVAADWYRAVLRLSHCETTALNLAISLINHGLQIKASDPKGAIRCYREALVNCPSNANAYYNLGVSYAEMHKYDKALINYQLTVHFDPRCAEAYNNMGVIFKEQENLEKALKYYHLAIQCNPRFAQSLNNLGVAYTTSGRLTEAFEYLARAVSVAPNYVSGSASH
ncbi:unnamed protein product [Cladocopium goreaui]|uniref:Probable UDP-N-acetylglucosamine--peptide N-acetylglucosaminyltransferase SPINDLY (GDP-fucose protei n O-fucosyltransferase SPINDLY) n=1 Tax=Cladocopium goreaui TaxID=2562237 RepID=A0A9P1G4L5_9DINO|nr:unnamed protein product [Cladocopium goreaui]